jgi:signal peptidase II
MRLTENPGAAFGALGRWSPFLILVGIVAVLVIVGMRKERSKSRALAVSLGLLLGGTIGNLIDRFRFNGCVTDFIDLDVVINFNGRSLTWPTFNFADVALTVGVLLLVYHVFIVERKTPEEKIPEESHNTN